ncbi:DUF397 domain-containing protein [Streptomyces sp. AV19]|nr:DUF397 domain-containing protein [Streptomyces sp. AV19]MDG4533146.1 DUF397 domain-containing protein [Streptomyces sp. AV19]
MPGPDLTMAIWRKSSHSGGEGETCVEVADHYPGLIPVRDSKIAPTGRPLILGIAAWSGFITAIADDSLTAAARTT